LIIDASPCHQQRYYSPKFLIREIGQLANNLSITLKTPEGERKAHTCDKACLHQLSFSFWRILVRILHMRFWILSIAFLMSCSMSMSAQAESRCHDPRGREAAIGGDTIYGIVFQNGKPLMNAQVKVYVSSTAKTAWVWRTDEDGKFNTPKLRRVAYRVDITGRGSAVVKVGSEQEKLGQQTINWLVQFGDDGCVGASMSTD
jgi:hypothetical protein